eukprot:CAMPEP_0116116004 /NCGR_PEP_ID=MMETSP0329-20121206/806_1 /TAXON_ID=697910 /ORGANISM="Pseudo-nitzschia arenysensis, Strain B593" /LENGTH=388 /DNA_ID=CAMNT_0003609469 /DNA_START=61 /DNA_END=1227 /DNA_ORIENTATION=+
MASSTTSRKRIVGWDIAGEPPRKRKGHVETLKFTICDFEKRKGTEKICSSTLEAHGRKWEIRCYPENNEKTHVGCFLVYLGDDSITVSYTFRCKNRNKRNQTTFKSNSTRNCWGVRTFITRSLLKEYLEDNGSLVIEVDIQLTVATDNAHQIVWYPPEFQHQDILVDLFQDASSETADVTFSVGKKTEFRAHKNILALRCKKLYEITEGYEDDTPIIIDATSPKIFKSILDFVYTVKLPDIDNKNIATELLVAADRFECVELKLYVESIIVDNFLAPKNAAELLLFADSHSCALLKEAATNVFVSNSADVKEAKAWSQITESKQLLLELVDALTYSDDSDEENCEDFARMDVATLRNKLQEENLELDGSREVLVQRLEKFYEEDEEGT